MIFDSGKDQRGIAFADFRHDYAYGETALLTQHARHHVRTVVQFARGGANAGLGMMGNRLGGGRAVHHQRNGGDRQAQMVSEFAKIDLLFRGFLRSSTFIGFGACHWSNGCVVWHRSKRAASHADRQMREAGLANSGLLESANKSIYLRRIME